MIDEVLSNEQVVKNQNWSTSAWDDDGKRCGVVDDFEEFEILGDMLMSIEYERKGQSLGSWLRESKTSDETIHKGQDCLTKFLRGD